jgi:hypothetical protein
MQHAFFAFFEYLQAGGGHCATGDPGMSHGQKNIYFIRKE